MARELLSLTATDMVQRFRGRELSPVEVARAMLQQIDRLNDTVNAYCLVDHETTLALAAEAEQRWADGEPKGPLDGVPVAVKDVFMTPMWPTLKGSRVVDAAASMGSTRRRPATWRTAATFPWVRRRRRSSAGRA
ncbi:MAG: amidase family protein [Gammaproteobacteria bacterium]|nr:amidase family protein [Gammaproteobacteria bacterium]